MQNSSALARRGRAVRSVALLAALGLGLSACSGGEESAEGGSSAPEGSASATGSPSEGSSSQGSGQEPGSSQGTGSSSGANESGGEGSPSSGGGAAATAGPSKPEKPANETFLREVDVVKGDIRPKSVVANDHGKVIANNMMYQHTMTVYDATSHELLHTISDSVDAEEMGVEGSSGTVEGAPVEAAFTEDGATAYVTNYQMYGDGFTPHGGDLCEKGEVTDHGYIYEVDVEKGAVKRAFEAGAVPKYAALSPDEKTLLVSNWCDFDLSVIDTESGQETGRIPLGRWARGIDYAPDGTAFATAMGTPNVYRIDPEAGTSEVFATPGDRIRHVSVSPDGKYLYVVASGAYKQFETSRISKLDAKTGKVLGQVHTGNEPRSMDVSGDGTALYVVNYYSDTMSKIDAETMEVVQEEPTGHHPIGITYDDSTHKVWVASYVGSIQVFDDTADSAQGASAGK
ncbi:40-residue YVTN family beta-propeller repeat-containing protein [Kytococcus aerolatus]|uniref:40-residue YVTN family beta-propeller repeat-containing protein n=1 Tax=Kytococcus aerolatus TaxID=592308 RepID=A0A212TZ78_9MICO|nr:cytochrome D1 domain-containing protein [Kytococcus aerolatus]SNC71305.1 40-residue YVTN family beta-propeller repeat-containing protein [Kytococcus aerolatus]